MKQVRIIYTLIFTVSILSMLMLTSCGKGSNDEKLFAKAQSIYNKKGWEKFVKYVNKNGYFPISDGANNGATPLLIAVKNKDINSFNLFIEKGASASEKDATGANILDYALQNFDKELTTKIIEIMEREYWNTKDLDGKVPLIYFICNCNDYETVKKVLMLTKNIDEEDNKGKTLLMYAAQCNTDVRVTKLLLDNYAKIDNKNNNEWTALMYASRYNPNPMVMEDLLLRGAASSPNSVGLTITMLAACNPNPGVLLTLIKYINDVNAKTDKDKTALMYACENKQSSSVIKILTANKADLNVKDKDGKTALMYALENYNEPEAPYLLIAAGAECHDVDNAGKAIKDYLAANNNLKDTDLAKAIELKLNDKKNSNDQEKKSAENKEKNNNPESVDDTKNIDDKKDSGNN